MIRVFLKQRFMFSKGFHYIDNLTAVNAGLDLSKRTSSHFLDSIYYWNSEFPYYSRFNIFLYLNV